MRIFDSPERLRELEAEDARRDAMMAEALARERVQRDLPPVFVLI